MNKKLVFFSVIGILVIFQPIVMASTQAQNYYNSEGGFSLTVPAGWGEFGNMEEISRKLSAAANRPLNYVAGFGREGSAVPYMYIQIKKSGKISETDIQKILDALTQKKTYRAVKEALDKSTLKDSISNFSATGEPIYLTASHRALWTAKYQFQNKNRVVLNTIIFSNYGYVLLLFYSAEEDFNNNLNDFMSMMDSFEFSKELKY